MPFYQEHITVETRIYECKGAFGLRNTVIYDNDDNPCLVSWATGAFVNIDTARPFRLPTEITDHIVLDPKFEMEYSGRRVDVPEAESKTVPPVVVTALDIDVNRHMNNGRYIKTAMRFLPDDFIISRFRVEYKKPAVKGDFLHPRITSRDEDKIYILLTDETESPYTVMEFISSHRRGNNA
jgi:acyl-ACP thioesterase